MFLPRPVSRQRFVSFITASTVLPPGDKQITITHVSWGPERLPLAHTCFDRLDLPEYGGCDLPIIRPRPSYACHSAVVQPFPPLNCSPPPASLCHFPAIRRPLTTLPPLLSRRICRTRTVAHEDNKDVLKEKIMWCLDNLEMAGFGKCSKGMLLPTVTNLKYNLDYTSTATTTINNSNNQDRVLSQQGKLDRLGPGSAQRSGRQAQVKFFSLQKF